MWFTNLAIFFFFLLPKISLFCFSHNVLLNVEVFEIDYFCILDQASVDQPSADQVSADQPSVDQPSVDQTTEEASGKRG